MVQLVQPLQRGEQPEYLAEPLGLELPELQQVERRRDEREGEHGQAQDAHGDVQDRPRTAPCDRPRVGHETDEQGQPDEPRPRRMRGPANQEGIFRMSRTGMPGTRLGCSMLRISPEDEWSRVCTISTTTCTCCDDVPGRPDAGLNASNTSPGLTPSARPRLMKMIC